MKNLILPFVFCGYVAVAGAQEPAGPPPLPGGPLLNKAEDFSQWTVIGRTSAVPIVEPPAASPSASVPPTAPVSASIRKQPDQQVVVIKTKPIRFEETTTAEGKKVSKWTLPDMMVTDYLSGTPVVTFASKRGKARPEANIDFPGFDWISAKNFEGIKKFAGHDCLVFRDTFKIDGKTFPSDPQLMNVACIDAESRLPLALQLADEVRTYQFGAPPTAMLTMPPAIDGIVSAWRKSIRQASMPLAKP